MDDFEKQRLKESMDRIERLFGLGAPRVIIAHYLVNVMIPRLVKVLGIVPEFSEQLVGFASSKLAAHSGVCTICRRCAAVFGDTVCAKCAAELDEFFPEEDEDDEEEA